MKLGIIGSGMIVKTFLPCAQNMSEYELVAIASTERSFSQTKQLAEQYKIKKVYSNYHLLLDDQEVEVVYIATPNHLHYIMCKEALQKDKNIICEKPFVADDKQLIELAELAKEKKLFLLEAIAPTFYPNVAKIKEVLPLIGDIKIISGNYSKYSSRYSAFKQGTILPTFDINCCGGALMDINIYNIHMLSLLFGEGENVQYHANVKNGIDTSGIITVDYPEFKAVLIGSKDCTADNYFCIQGENGTIEIKPSSSSTKDIYVYLKDETIKYLAEENVHYMYYEFKKFAEIIENKDYNQADDLMKISQIVMRTATKARYDAKIYFPSDNMN